jgi:RNA polymerase sigma-70 factor (ECF subfamily)
MSETSSFENALGDEGMPSSERLLLDGLRRGETGASHQFFREYYPRVYRYLYWLTRQPETAEDLAQETFVRAWRFLDRFDGHGSLRAWLHCIAHREFLRFVRSRRDQTALEEAPEIAAPRAAAWMEELELREVIEALPAEQREVTILHYLEGYECEEIARIVGAPAGTVKSRLWAARARLRQALGEGDLSYLNGSPLSRRRWVWPPLEEMRALEARLTDRSSTPPPEEPVMPSDKLSRRDFLSTAAGAGAAALTAGSEADTIDDRLTRKVALAFKATALTDLCAHLSAEAGVKVVAGASVADEKVTVFCKPMPLRDVMRQLSRPFGYTWVRGRDGGSYRYELTQDLQSQLLEEELRNRDRTVALLALEKEIERYRPYLELSPDEAVERAKSVPPAEKELLKWLSGSGWGAIQMYFRLSPRQQAALRAGQSLHFSQSPKQGEESLPPEIARGVLRSFRDVFFHRYPDGFGIGTGVKEPGPEEIRPADLPEARAHIDLSLRQTELGRITLSYQASAGSESDLPRNSLGTTWDGDGSLASAMSPTVAKPDNRAFNARLARESALEQRVTIETAASCRSLADRESTDGAPPAGDGPRAGEPRATSADVLEAVHRATGLPVVADFYTKLYAPETLSVREQPLFDALSETADTMHLRWRWDDGWLQFRSVSYYDDRLKEVPNRLLSRWAASRKQHGALTLDDLVEIAGLTDAQLDASGTAEGARDCWGLVEWLLAQREQFRPHLRFMAGLTLAQRQEAMGPLGLPFVKLPLAQQQQFIALALPWDNQPLQGLNELQGAAMRVEYRRPGAFEWIPLGNNWYQWTVPIVPGREGRRAILPAVQGRTRDEALAAARRLDTPLLEAIFPEASRLKPEIRTAEQVPDAGEIRPTRLDLRIIYIPGLSNKRNIRIVSLTWNMHLSTW